jgi:hypothetical protein
MNEVNLKLKTKLEEPLLTMDLLHEFLQSLINSPIGLRRKVVLLQRYVDNITKIENYEHTR